MPHCKASSLLTPALVILHGGNIKSGAMVGRIHSALPYTDNFRIKIAFTLSGLEKYLTTSL